MDIMLLVAMVAIFYFLIIRPENKRKKKAEEMRNSLKKGERIITIGGVVGKIVQLNEESVVVETSEDRVRVEFMKWAVQTTEAMEKAAAMMATLRNDVPATVGGAAVTGVNDYQISLSRNLVTGKCSEILLPKSNVLELNLGDRGSVIARPSGTEPKVKFYYTAVGKTKDDAQALLDAMIAQMSK